MFAWVFAEVRAFAKAAWVGRLRGGNGAGEGEHDGFVDPMMVNPNKELVIANAAKLAFT